MNISEKLTLSLILLFFHVTQVFAHNTVYLVDFPPYFYVNKSQQLEGIFIDALQIANTKLNHEYRFVAIPSSRVLSPLAQRGKNDIFLAALVNGVVPSYFKSGYCGKPFARVDTSIFQRVAAKKSRAQSIGDLKGDRIIAVGPMARDAKLAYPNIEMNFFNPSNPRQGFRMFLKGRATYILDFDIRFNSYYVSSNSSFKYHRFKLYSVNGAFCAKLTTSTSRAAINQLTAELYRLRESAVMKALEQKHGVKLPLKF